MGRLIAKNSLRIRYLVGLSVIALLITASFVTMKRVISEQREFSTLVNMAGHQSGLSNRVAYFASLMASTTDETEFNMAKSQIGLTINKMRHAHEILRHGDPEQNIPLVINENLQIIYEDPMVGLDKALNNFLERAEQVYRTGMDELSLKSIAYIYLTTYGPHVLEPLLDGAVEEYEKIGRQAILKIEKFELIIWLTAMLTLIFEIVFIFVPMEKRVIGSLDSLEASIEELTGTRERLLAAQELALVGDWQFDLQARRLTCSEQIYTICGLLPEDTELDYARALGFVHLEDRRAVLSSLTRLIRYRQASMIEFRVVREDGSERLAYQYAVVKKKDSDGSLMISGTIQDITDRKELSTKLEKLSDHIPGFLFQMVSQIDGKISIPFLSRGLLETCGLEPAQVTEEAQHFFDLLHPDDYEQILASIQDSANKLERWRAEFRVAHPHKGLVWLEGHATPEILIDGKVQWFGYIWDITARKQSESRIRKLALYDPLTGLANRRLLKDRLSQALMNSRRSNSFGSVIMLDLDNFKSLNDTKGHEVGDQLLAEVSQRLKNCVRETDTIARLGGDEFVVILEHLGIESGNAEKKALEVAEKIRVALARLYYLSEGSHVHHGSASIGLTLFQGTGENESDLLKHADVAMYEAKDLGRNLVCLYSAERQALIDRKSSLSHHLRTAIENDEFSLYLQPQVRSDGSLCGAETLLRWQLKGQEFVAPGTFIPIAESTGSILPIGEWVLEECCHHLKALEDYQLPADFTLAVNISARQFADSGFCRKTKEIIQRNGIEPRRLKIELTESCIVQDINRTSAILRELAEFGLAIELDDFGTGYSSLNSLNKLPISNLKIDRSLISGINSDNSTNAIIRATLAMSRAMSVGVIAEGVETVQQQEFLIAEGCEVMQGFLFARPMPFEQFVTCFRHDARRASQFRNIAVA